MASLDTPIARQVLSLDKDFKIGDLTFDVVGRFTKTSDTTYTVGKQIFTASIGRPSSEQEGIYIDVSANPTEIDADRGVYRYTVAQASYRGIDTDNSVAPPTLAQTGNQKLHRAGKQIGISIDPAYYAELLATFDQNSDEDEAELGEAIAQLLVVAIDKSDSKLYKFDSSDSNHNIVGILKTGEGGTTGDTKTYIRIGGRSTGHTGLTAGVPQYASTSSAGAITETANQYKLGEANDDGTVVNTAGSVAITSFLDSEFEVKDEGDTTKKVVEDIGSATTGKTLTRKTAHTDDRTLTYPDKTDTLATLGDIDNEYYGDGSDGALDTTSAPVNIALDTLKEYSSMIVHTNALSTAGSDGVMVVRCKGDCTISDSGLIDLAGKGAAGGASAAQLTASDSATSGNVGTSATTDWILDGASHHGLAGSAAFGGGEAAASGGSGGASKVAGGASSAAVAGGSTGAAAAASAVVDLATQALKQPWSFVGAGGGSGAQATDTGGGTHRAQGGAGGAGAAGLILYVGGNLTLSTATSIDASGTDGGAGDVSGGAGTRADAAGGGGGGAGGGVLIFVKGTITGDTSKIDITGGGAGTAAEVETAGTATATAGGAGGEGFALIQKDHS